MKCSKCDGSGLLPLILPDGTKSRYAKIFCQCRQELAYQPRLRPEDIDFPVSYSVYRGLCQEHGWPDPGSDIPMAPSKPLLSDLSEPQPWQKDQWQSVQQLRAMNLHLNKQVKELLAKEKRAKLVTPSDQAPEGESRIDITRKLYPNT